MADADSTALRGRPSKALIYRYYSLTDGLHRLVDFHLVATGQQPRHFVELASLQPAVARRLYEGALHHGIADLATYGCDDAYKRAARVIGFAISQRSLEGIESMFLTSMAIFHSQGLTIPYNRGVDSLKDLPRLQQLGGGLESALCFDMKSRLLSGLSLNAIQGLLDPADVHKALLRDKDPISQVASAVERDKSEGFECKEQTAKAAAVAGSLIGKQYGERAYGAAGAALGGGIGGPSGAFIGRVVGEMYGREMGPVHGYIVGEAIGTVAGEYICGDSKPEPTPLPSPDPVVPADSTPVPAVSPTPTEAPEVPPLSDTDAPEKPEDVGNPEDVGRRTDEWMDETDPTDREPKPGDTPRDHVARVRNERYLPDEYIDRASRMPNPNQRSFHGLPRRVTLNDGTVVDWGPMAPYILYTANNPGSTRECIREIMRAVPFTPDPRFPGRERLDPTVVNPVRDAFSTQQMVREIVERAKRRT